MRTKIALGLCGLAIVVAGCSKHDPILPGERNDIFDTYDVQVLGTDIDNLPDTVVAEKNADCPYTQDKSNVIWNGDKKIFSGFPTSNSVKSTQKPVCSGNYVYAGLTTGELVKVNAKNRAIAWIADIYRPSNMTGGAAVVDITAPIVLHNDYVFVGGHGDAFCKVVANNGIKKWCANIGVAVPFIVTDNVSFVIGTDNYAYAIRNSDGAIYWRTQIKKQTAPKYENKTLTVGREKINAVNGEIIK